MRQLLSPMPDSVTLPQRSASDPRASAWVRANAGSGKTHVLTERVLRLLLAGARPEEILCLTYTKAGAAEMRRRVAARLAEWAVMPEPELREKLTALEGAPPQAETLARARTLFAHALETPGGLRISTIHAFCESVLHRFPLEAGVPFGFTVVEDVEAASLLAETRASVIAEGLRGGSAPIAGAVETLFRLLSDHLLTLAIDAALAEARRLRHVLADAGGAKARLRRFVAMPKGETRDDILRRAVAETAFPDHLREALFEHLPPEPERRRNLRFVDRLWAARAQLGDGETLFDIFLKDDGSPYKDHRAGGITDAALKAAVAAEHNRLAGLAPALRRATLVERSEALLDLVTVILARYDARKRARAWLDFDDLVAAVGALLEREEAAWVSYRLDAAITHILVDESQDTNPEQWAIVKKLADDFFAGDSAAQRLRTVFAVGDEKQSIFSFQGAQPTLFGETGREFHMRAEAAHQPFRRVPLHTSFRTLKNVLTAVDRVFATEKLRGAVMEDDRVEHATARAEAGGSVTLWPWIKDEADPIDGERWPTEPVAKLTRAPRRLAERIAGEIRGWLDSERPLGPRGRAVKPEDILILVQSRSALFAEIIRALALRGIPTPGADRLPVSEHIAVRDLLALGDVLANPADDLQLAALLRSPLFDLSEEELFRVAHGRPKGQALWQALELSPELGAGAAAQRLKAWRAGLDFGRPFEFYARILYREGGLRLLHTRLGGEIDDVIAEFLELALHHEQSPAPALQAFLAEMRLQDISIKRDLTAPGSGVRIMTVHGAKGLEAPIIILADAATRPAPGQLPHVYIADDGDGPFLIHGFGRKAHTEETQRDVVDTVSQAIDAEYWRKLYVGMTRAEDELYVTGYLTQNGKVENTWYEAIETALADDLADVASTEDGVAARIFPRLRPAPAIAATKMAPVARPGPVELPPLPPPALVPVVRPSLAFAAVTPERAHETAAESLGELDPDLARRQGIALHALLQHLPRFAPAERAAAARKAVTELLPDAPALHEGVAAKAISILARPESAHLFGGNSRAEVPFLLDGSQNGRPVRFAGRFDRLVVAAQRVLVVDYKSDAAPPIEASGVAASYRMQLGLYAKAASQLFPGFGVEAGIFWTSMESLMILPSAMLAEAAAAFTIA